MRETQRAPGNAALSAAVSAAGLDGVVLLSPEAFTYATGVRIPSHTLMRWRHAAALVTPDGLAGVLAVDMEQTTVAAELPGVQVHGWREFVDDAMSVLAGALRTALPPGRSRVGIETDFVPVAAMRRLEELLPEIEWLPCQELVADCRSRKSETELAKIRELSVASDEALAHALRTAQAGDTETEIGASIISALYSAGITEHRVLIVASGERSQYPNVAPSERRIGPRELVRVEVFASHGGYQAGVARTAVVHEPEPGIAALWTQLSKARAAGLAELRPGADPRAVYQAYLDSLGPLRDRAIAFFGHGMGLDVHEPPYLSAVSSDAVYEGSVLGIEPFTMLPDLAGGLQVKDVVAVTADGYSVLSDRLDGGELFVIR